MNRCEKCKELRADFKDYTESHVAYVTGLEQENKRIKEALENLVCEADYLSCHEIDGGAPDNRWEDMRKALYAAKLVVGD
jgi:hypothetical protein